MSDYHEPWHYVEVVHPEYQAIPELAHYFRIKEYVIMGQGIWDSSVSYSLVNGNALFADDRGIIAKIYNSMTKEGRLDPKEYARRIVACINFCRDVDTDSVEVGSLRDLLDRVQELERRYSKESINLTWRPKERQHAADQIQQP